MLVLDENLPASQSRSLRDKSVGRLAAFTRQELIVLIAILAVLISIMAIKLVHARENQIRRACVQNLKNVGLAFRISSTDSSDRFPFEKSIDDGGTKEYTNVWQHFRAISNELSTPKILVCPSSAKKIAKDWLELSNANITYFIGITAKEDIPESFLSGDSEFLLDGALAQSSPVFITTNSNIAYPKSIHRFSGNILMGVGSVYQLSGAELHEALQRSEVPTNIILLPR